MAKLNPFHEASLEVAQSLRDYQKEAEKGSAVPFGQQKVRAEQLRQRLLQDRSLRERMLQEEGGRERILSLFRGQRGS